MQAVLCYIYGIFISSLSLLVCPLRSCTFGSFYFSRTFIAITPLSPNCCSYDSTRRRLYVFLLWWSPANLKPKCACRKILYFTVFWSLVSVVRYEGSGREMRTAEEHSYPANNICQHFYLSSCFPTKVFHMYWNLSASSVDGGWVGRSLANGRQDKLSIEIRVEIREGSASLHARLLSGLSAGRPFFPQFLRAVRAPRVHSYLNKIDSPFFLLSFAFLLFQRHSVRTVHAGSATTNVPSIGSWKSLVLNRVRIHQATIISHIRTSDLFNLLWVLEDKGKRMNLFGGFKNPYVHYGRGAAQSTEGSQAAYGCRYFYGVYKLNELNYCSTTRKDKI